MGFGEWCGAATVLLVILCIFWWIVIWLKMLVYMLQGRCPKGRVCTDSQCKLGAWCKKYQRHDDILESMMELRIKEENRHNDKE